MEDPKIPETIDMTVGKKAVKWKVRLWSQEVDRYGDRHAALEGNKGGLYVVLMEGVSKIIKLNLKINTRYTKAGEVNDSIWLLEFLEDILINFEDVKPKTLVIDEQMERIMKFKQGESINEDFLKQVQKELNVYEKHGGDFLWGGAQDT